MNVMNIPFFDRYIGIDYSGAETSTASLKGLRVYSVAAWMRRADLEGCLARFFHPSMSAAERTVAQVEGWIMGIK
jgi:hypothetical protein